MTEALTSAAPLIRWSFAILMALSALLYLVVHLRPRALVRFNSVPWAFHLERATDLRYQAVLYGAFHTHPWARVSHYSLAWDQPFWFALLWIVHPLLPVLALGLLGAQAALLRAPRLAAVLTLTWASVAALGWGLVQTLGPEPATLLSMAVLVFGGALRFLGHLGEPLPPGLVEDGRFVPMRRGLGRLNVMLVGPLIGVVSEFAAAFPFRLFLVQVLWLSEKLGVTAPEHGSVREHMAEVVKVHEGGWSASPVTAWMMGRGA
ncbi:MAG: hypothetical protein H6740_18210 [Alphaproteobacteria bacterium]|nr:hypothetical protein [Alphaproteobacteria bacterium]